MVIGSRFLMLKNLRTGFMTLLVVGVLLPIRAQSVTDFVISSPQPAIQLSKVDRIGSNNLQFTFTNNSSKTLLEICISAQRGAYEMVCKVGSANEAKLPGPGDTFSMNFDASGFSSDLQQSTLRVNAVVFTDGSHFGERKVLASIASRMFGMALETKRISDILSKSTDPSAMGLDGVLTQIGASLPSSPHEAAEGLKGQSLPGVSAVIISSYLNGPTSEFQSGVALARGSALREISDKKALALQALSGSQTKRTIVLEARSRGLSDLAQKYSALDQAQTAYIISFMGAANEQ